MYTPDPAGDVVTVPLLPQSLRQQALKNSHDIPSAGHQGVDKTLYRLRHEAYWVNMAGDVERYCRQCTRCQQCKAPAPIRAPLTSLPIGRPWQMIAVDILEVPVSVNNSRYLLVIQDYFTKWAEAIPLRDQTALAVTTALINLFSKFGIPDIVHCCSALLRVLLAYAITWPSCSRTAPRPMALASVCNTNWLALW